MCSLNLNESKLKPFCENVSKKKVLAASEEVVVKEFLTYMQIHGEYMKNANAYEVASIMRSFFTWYSNKDKEPKRSHSIGFRDVYYVDLGAYNLKYESGFIHPCIVLRGYGSNILVAPCSSKKYGKNDELIFDISKGKPFRENTGVLLDQIRTVSITRFKGFIGKIDSETFQKITEQIIKKYFCKIYHDFEKQKIKNKKLEDQISELNEKVNELESQLLEKEKIINSLNK